MPIDKNLEVISIFGSRGSAKTTKLKELLNDPKRKRVFIYDLKNEYRFKKIRGQKALWKFLKANWNKPFKISYVPEALETPDHIIELSNICYALAKAQQNDEAKGVGNNITIVVEEMSVTAPNYKYPNGQGGFPYCVNVAREWGVEVIGVSQRPAQANTDFRGNATDSYYFALSKKLDVDAVRGEIGKHADDLKSLQVGEYIRFHRGNITRGKTKKPRAKGGKNAL